MFWKMVVRSFKNFFPEFEKTKSVSLQLTQEVLKKLEQLETLIEGLNPQINVGVMRQEENVLKQLEREIETYKSFTYEVKITRPREINLRGTTQHTTTSLMQFHMWQRLYLYYWQRQTSLLRYGVKWQLHSLHHAMPLDRSQESSLPDWVWNCDREQENKNIRRPQKKVWNSCFKEEKRARRD